LDRSVCETLTVHRLTFPPDAVLVAADLKRRRGGAELIGRRRPVRPSTRSHISLLVHLGNGPIEEVVPRTRLHGPPDKSSSRIGLTKGRKERDVLAHFKPAIDKASRQLVLEAQDDVKLDKPLWLVRRVGKGDGHWQTQWAEPMRQFLDKVDYDPEAVAQRMYPLGKSRHVVIDPEMVFGIPQVKGVRTETIAETLSESGDEEAIAETWGLELEDVKAAIQWEIARAA
jgi:uncharacterized protein (DUF433 family)